MDLELSGKTAIVTGGSRGIGKAIARELALEGVDVAIVARGVGGDRQLFRQLAHGRLPRVLPTVHATARYGIAAPIRMTHRQHLIVIADQHPDTVVAWFVDPPQRA